MEKRHENKVQILGKKKEEALEYFFGCWNTL